MKKAATLLALSIITATFISCKTHGPTQQAGLVTSAPSPSTHQALEYITDDANVIDESTRKQLETTLAALK